jgi:hypothetical protein
MDTYLAFKKRYAFLQKDFQNTMNVLKKNVNDNKDWKPSKDLLDNMEILSHYLSIVTSKLVDIEECVVDGKTKKTPEDLELLENYRENSEIIERMKPLMFLMKLHESQ